MKESYMKKYTCSCLTLLFLLAVVPIARGNDKTTYPQRIISLGPINTENIYLLGAEDHLIADTIYCVNPPAARKKEKIGTLLQVNVEKIIGLNPDLVLATSLTRPRQVAQLRRLGISVVQFKQPAGFDDIAVQFVELGRLTGREKRARQIVVKARRAIDYIRQKTIRLPKRKVFLQVGTRPLFSSVATSFTNEFITLGGGENIAKGSLEGVYSREKVIAQNPDLIIIAIMGTEGIAGKKEKQKWMRYPSITAVKNENIHIIDPDLVCSPTPLSFVEALRTITSLIHPEIDINE
ncbi:MAG: ABC transporter substrate-binding protein [Deltaproteobacteria bacterium]|nr:MAG: ABC transporter substrate-binding protein [Deltaproteobacteria bacterium]